MRIWQNMQCYSKSIRYSRLQKTTYSVHYSKFDCSVRLRALAFLATRRSRHRLASCHLGPLLVHFQPNQSHPHPPQDLSLTFEGFFGGKLAGRVLPRSHKTFGGLWRLWRFFSLSPLTVPPHPHPAWSHVSLVVWKALLE